MAEDKGFEKIIERNGKSIYKIAFVYMKNRFDADDVYQEVLLRYLKYRPHFENCEHEKNWFVAVTINACKSFKTSAWQRHNVTVDDDSWLQILADNTESREISQDNAVMDSAADVAKGIIYLLCDSPKVMTGQVIDMFTTL